MTSSIVLPDSSEVSVILCAVALHTTVGQLPTQSWRFRDASTRSATLPVAWWTPSLCYCVPTFAVEPTGTSLPTGNERLMPESL